MLYCGIMIDLETKTKTWFEVYVLFCSDFRWEDYNFTSQTIYWTSKNPTWIGLEL